MSKIICTAGPNLGDEWEVHFGVTSIGRQAGNSVVLHDPKVSRQHAIIRFEEDKYTIVDLDSFNGTYIFGKKIAQTTIAPETPIQIGNSTLLFTRKSIRGGGMQHAEKVGEELLIKHKTKQAVMSEILQDLEKVKGAALTKSGVLRSLLKATQKLAKAPPKKKGLGSS